MHYQILNPAAERYCMEVNWSRLPLSSWIINEATLTVLRDFQIEGEGHEMPTIDRDTDGSDHE